MLRLYFVGYLDGTGARRQLRCRMGGSEGHVISPSFKRHVLDSTTEATLVSNSYSTCIEYLKLGETHIAGIVMSLAFRSYVKNCMTGFCGYEGIQRLGHCLRRKISLMAETHQCGRIWQ
jgi:hypothetical protein